MSNLDTLYRAFIDYRKVTSGDHDCAMQRNIVAGADSNNDFVETVKYTCHIEEDWVEAIEQGMVHVEKAIAEERQFIRNNGEVVPIEKVKRVSRDSVEHLAKHSDLITKEPPEGQPVIPDQLYTVERLSDYAVYENRFLYMLLKYLEQFISLRYNKIVELANTYRGKLQIDKNIKTGSQNIKFKVELNEERRNDPLLSELNPNKSLIERIATLYKMVTHYLSVPLMLEVSKAPMIHPPITVTNVLRMNHNFRGAMRLYEFVSSYDKPGYYAEKKVKKITPFPDIPADEFAEVEALASYLTYQYGMSVKDVLREEYNKQEDKRKRAAEKEHKKRLAALKKRIEESGESPEEYMLMLESRNRTLEQESAQLVLARAEIEKLKSEIDRLDATIAQLTMLAEDRAGEIIRLNQKYEYDVLQLNAEHEKAIEKLNEENKQAVAVIIAEHDEEINALQQGHEKEIKIIQSEYEDKIRTVEAPLKAEIAARDGTIESLREDNAKQRAECTAEIKRAQTECAHKIAEQQKHVDRAEKKLIDVVAENKLLAELKKLADARLTALKFKHGYMTAADDYTSELAFNEIERQYNIFSDFFKQTWRKTKKKIRKDLADKLLNTKQSADEAKKSVEKPKKQKDEPEQKPQEKTAEQPLDEQAQVAVQPIDLLPDSAAPKSEKAEEQEVVTKKEAATEQETAEEPKKPKAKKSKKREQADETTENNSEEATVTDSDEQD